jgi:hypothetical protein
MAADLRWRILPPLVRAPHQQTHSQRPPRTEFCGVLLGSMPCARSHGHCDGSREPQ